MTKTPTRDAILDRYAEAKERVAGVSVPQGPVRDRETGAVRAEQPAVAEFLRRGDVIKNPHQRGTAVRVLSVERDKGAQTVTIEFHPLDKNGKPKTSPTGPVVGLTTFRYWDQVSHLPSDQAGTNPANRTTNQGEATMATSNKTKRTVKRSGSKKGSAAKPAAKKASGSTRRTAEQVRALVPQFVKHLQGGGKMKELKAEHGFSDDGPIRSALYFEGYDSKGNKHGEEPGSINAGNKAGKAKVVALRGEGAGWYRLAFLTGLSEPEVKAIVTEAGGPTGRVYRASEKPAKAAPKATTKKATTKKKAAKPDPSPQA